MLCLSLLTHGCHNVIMFLSLDTIKVRAIVSSRSFLEKNQQNRMSRIDALKKKFSKFQTNKTPENEEVKCPSLKMQKNENGINNIAWKHITNNDPIKHMLSSSSSSKKLLFETTTIAFLLASAYPALLGLFVVCVEFH